MEARACVVYTTKKNPKKSTKKLSKVFLEKKYFALTYLATMIRAVATINKVAANKYFKGKGTGRPDDATSSLSRLEERNRTLMQDCVPARKYIRHALVR